MSYISMVAPAMAERFRMSNESWLLSYVRELEF